MKGMKGDGLSWMVSVPLLVFVGMLVLAMIGGFYIRTLVAGPPVQVTTYTEYRWMNYLPSAALFAITYSGTAEESPAWKALDEIAQYDAPTIPILLKRSELSDYFFGIDGLSNLDFGALDSRLEMVEESFNKGSSVKREFTLVKDSSGVILVYGMDKLLADVKSGNSAMMAFPEDYPYKCSQKETPVFSSKEGKENSRVQLVVCCQNIKMCSDYISQAGSGQCESDYCSVGPCRIIHPAGKERQCIENSPPEAEFEIAKAEGETDSSKIKWHGGEVSIAYEKDAEEFEVIYKITVEEDSTIKGISIDWGDGPVEAVSLDGAIVAAGTSLSSKEGLAYNSAMGEASAIEVKTSLFYGTHTYDGAGDYNVKCKLWDERDNPVEKEIKLKIMQS